MNTDDGRLAALHAHFLRIMPRIELHARIHFRHLKCPGKRDDAIAEAIAVSWKWFLRIDEQEKDVDEFVSALATYAVRHVRSGRRLCGQERSKDALSPLAQRRHGFLVQALPEHDTSPEDNPALAALTDNTITPPPEQAAFRIDYPRWLSSLRERKARIAQDMSLGFTTQELAPMHGVSMGRISQLRGEFHSSWHTFTGRD
jgi:hypothetical protein